MAEYQTARYYVGVPCPHCGLKNTVADVYRWGIEGWCMSCTREFTLTEAQKDIARRQANDTAHHSNAGSQEVSRLPSKAQVQRPSPRSGDGRRSNNGRGPGPRMARG